MAFDFGSAIWVSFPEYLIRLAQAAKDELGRDVRELRTKFLTTFLGPDLEGTLRRELAEAYGDAAASLSAAVEFGLSRRSGDGGPPGARVGRAALAALAALGMVFSVLAWWRLLRQGPGRRA